MNIGMVARACRACGSLETMCVMHFREQPVHVGLVYDSKAEARSATKADIELWGCTECGFCWNKSFDETLLAFGPGYDASLSHSPSYLAHLQQTADRLVTWYGVTNEVVFDIGCGKGEFLRAMGRAGHNRGIGVDPTQDDFADRTDSIEFRRASYNEQQASTECGIVCCVSVLEDIQNLSEFLALVRRQCENNNCVAYFEVFHAAAAIEQLATWTIHYEQCNYFGESSLRLVFERSGFEILALTQCLGDQYMSVDVAPRVEKVAIEKRAPDLCSDRIARLFKAFRAQHFASVERWNVKLRSDRSDSPVVLWGSGGRGVTFLNSIDEPESVDFVVDLNRDKSGKYTAVTGHLIVAPEELVRIQPKVIIISNPNYESEIRKQIRDLGITSEVECI